MKLTKRITSACTLLLCFLIVALLAGCTTKTSPQNSVVNDGGEYVTENGVFPILKQGYKAYYDGLRVSFAWHRLG